MTFRPPPASGAERLVRELVVDPTDPLAGELLAWLAASARYRTWVEAHRSKIRKKLRGATDPSARADVRAELRAASLLLADRHIELAFEAYGSGRVGPDFTIDHRGEHLNLEVTRTRRTPADPGIERAILAKLRQLPPSVPNALLVAFAGRDATAIDVAGGVRALRDRADRKDEAFFATRGFEGTRGFYERFLRLGAILVWCEAGAGEARAAAWTNPSARLEAPIRTLRATLAALRAG